MTVSSFCQSKQDIYSYTLFLSDFRLLVKVMHTQFVDNNQCSLILFEVMYGLQGIFLMLYYVKFKYSLSHTHTHTRTRTRTRTRARAHGIFSFYGLQL
jgi:hypothetical protein